MLLGFVGCGNDLKDGSLRTRARYAADIADDGAQGVKKCLEALYVAAIVENLGVDFAQGRLRALGWCDWIACLFGLLILVTEQ